MRSETLISKCNSFLQMRKPVTSPYVVVRHSKIHGNGVFAKKDIPKGAKVIEYVGEKVTKKESDKRADDVIERASHKAGEGLVYMFELNKRYDIDGNVSWNTARFINHSCDPNCETDIENDRIWITAIKDIKKGEELSYDYGYDFEHYEDHPCKCGSKNCVGFILSQDDWPKLKKSLAMKKFWKNIKKAAKKGGYKLL